MADITHNDSVVTESKLTEFYNDIKPFLGCPAYLTSEGTSDYYSTDEKVIGRWVDGKPLYQKSYVYTSFDMNSDKPLGLTNCTVINFDGLFVGTVHKYIYPFNYQHPEYQNQYATATSISDEGKISVRTTSALRALDTYDMVLTVKYTKTTDSASTTIQEDPNEYSTDEKIIGKWIDGKPLYQKTFQFDNMIIDGTQQNFGSLSGLNIGSYAEVVRSTLNEDNYWTNPGILCVWVRVPQNNFGVRMVDGISRHGSLYFTIQYTKTTD